MENTTTAMAVPDQSTSQTALDWQGSYAGDLPGADVSEIRVTIVLEKNGKYFLTRQYADHSGIFRETGQFQWTDGGRVVDLLNKHGHLTRYQVQENGLLPLMANGQPIPPIGDQHWRLHKVSELSSTHELYASFRWQLQSLAGAKSVLGAGGKAPYIVFLPDSQRVSGWDGCNRIAGSYTVAKDHKLHFGPMISTRMACMDVTVDQAFSKTLTMTTAFRFDQGKLLLLNSKGTVMTSFIAAPQPEHP
ncbi:META domain-containing protein [Acidithiobacillus sp. IBUN Pt1247-S3]|uniref:META domain-containing protein n=1 Tax=Acidithiobacillus sp. IBUN Pt1247-S3 TaxID=3166642 RepID=UPI0034E59200